MPAQFVLFESASGYGLFEAVETEDVGSLLPQVQKALGDLSKFSKLIKLKAFQAFRSAENALENINSVSEGIVSEDLKTFLEQNLPSVKPGKKAKFQLGVIEPKIGTAVQEALSIPCNTNESIQELIRGIRMHLDKYIKGLEHGVMQKAQLGLSHSYSRAKVKFNVNRSDNMIIQAICLLDQLDKDLNTFAMRVKEWYSWHFPELSKIVKDNYIYARCAKLIGIRSTLSEEKLPALAEVVMDEDVAKQVLEAARASMGMDLTEVDLMNIDNFATRLVRLAEFRKQLYEYLVTKMSTVAPNLGTLIGEMVAARLISHAGSLTNLAKCPASTVQILGAEKALFRALKTRGNTPKYGLIFHSSFIGRAGAKNKGRISRYLANKCSIAARIDSFADFTTTKFGERLRDQVEERLTFFDTGEAPKKNVDVMQEVWKEVAATLPAATTAAATPAAKKRSREEDESTPAPKKSKKDKSAKKKKKAAEEDVSAAAATPDTKPSKADKKSAKKSEKKKKKKKSSE